MDQLGPIAILAAIALGLWLRFRPKRAKNQNPDQNRHGNLASTNIHELKKYPPGSPEYERAVELERDRKKYGD